MLNGIYHRPPESLTVEPVSFLKLGTVGTPGRDYANIHRLLDALFIVPKKIDLIDLDSFAYCLDFGTSLVASNGVRNFMYLQQSFCHTNRVSSSQYQRSSYPVEEDCIPQLWKCFLRA